MLDWPIWMQASLLGALLLVSAFFSISETSMVAINHHRLKVLADQGSRPALLIEKLLANTEQLLSVILFGNNLVNTALPVITAAIATHTFGDNAKVISISTAAIAFAIIVFCEIIPKVIGSKYPLPIALKLVYLLYPITKIVAPVVWIVNTTVSKLLRIFGLTGDAGAAKMSIEELRAVVTASGDAMGHKPQKILMNLFDLDEITVDDLMTPRVKVEGLDMSLPLADVLQQLETCYHNKLPVYFSELSKTHGFLHTRKLTMLLGRARDTLEKEDIMSLLTPAYFIPSGTPVIKVLQHFQEDKQRLGLIVNEYGDVQGLISLEDILEQLIGQYTTSLHLTGKIHWDNDGQYIADGSDTLRDLNRYLALDLPLDNAKTLNGLIIDYLQEIPEYHTSFRMGGAIIEVMQSDNHMIKSVKLIRLNDYAPALESNRDALTMPDD